MLIDAFNRKLTYLRLSVTDVCNFRCDYCLPNGYPKTGSLRNSELSVAEIAVLVKGFAELGTKKVRITGGEPSLRKDLPDIIHTVASTQGIETVCLSTNGYRLGKDYKAWLDAGLNQVNVSIDSFDPATFADITGHDILPKLLDEIDLLLSENQRQPQKDQLNIKLNGVLKVQHAYDNLMAALDYVRTRPITYRFIEFMQTSDNRELFFAEHARAEHITNFLEKQGWQANSRKVTDGPATEYTHPDYAGSIGMIAPYSPQFCDTCNRVRVSSQGKIHLCLFDQVNHDLRPHLQHSNTESLKTHLSSLATIKPESHLLHKHNSGLMNNLSLVGG